MSQVPSSASWVDVSAIRRKSGQQQENIEKVVKSQPNVDNFQELSMEKSSKKSENVINFAENKENIPAKSQFSDKRPNFIQFDDNDSDQSHDTIDEDEISAELAKILKNTSPEDVVNQVNGLDRTHPLFNQIVPIVKKVQESTKSSSL